MKRGLLIVLSGPSGVGKGTVRKKVFKDLSLNLAYSISMTTRQPRNGERHGVEYFFITTEEFEQKIKEDAFLEYTKFVGNYYGTPYEYVEQLRNEGKNVFLEIEIEGAKKVLSKCKGDDVISIFLVPPSLEELERRIRGRKSETDDIIQERLAKARREIGFKDNYEYVVVNNNLSKACYRIKQIIHNRIKKLEKKD
jgi:guanylate kinase